MIDVVFIAGSGRSGTTLIDRVLGRAEGAFSAGELQYVWERGFERNELCGCGVPLLECDVWRAVHTGLGEWNRPERIREVIDAKRRCVAPLGRWATPRYGAVQRTYLAALERLYDQIATITGATTIIDSSKNALYAGQLAKLPNVRLKVVHVVRDSRAVAYSWSTKKERKQPGARYMIRHGAVGSTARWVYHNLQAERLRGRVETYVQFRYEDFAEEAEPVMRNVADRLQLDLPARLLEDGRVALPADHTCAGNPSRFTTGTVTIQPDRRWRDGMAVAPRAITTACSWPLLVRYGYRPREEVVDDVQEPLGRGS